MKPLACIAIVLACTAPAAAQESQGDSSARQSDGWVFRWKEHPEIEWSGGLRVEFYARFQGEGRASQAAIERGNGDGFDVGRRRIGVAGEIGNRLEFQVEGELEERAPWRDVYLNYWPLAGVQLQGGQFKLPFGLEETTGGTKLDFVYRSLVSTRLAPGRDSGLMAHGRLFKKVLDYELGVFAHDGGNARPNGGDRVFGGRTLAGRVTIEPFRGAGPLGDLQGAVAFTRSRVPEGFPALRGRSVLGVSFFEPDLWVQGHRRRHGVHLRWRPGPFSVASEYVRVSDDRRGQSVDGTDLLPFLARGWYVSGTWVVAGANRATSVDNPRRPLFGGGFGSIQLAVRVERLSLGDDSRSELSSTSQRAESIQGNRDTATTFGATWYPTRWIRIRANVIREDVGDPARGPLPHLGFWSRVVGFQFAI